MESGVGAGEGTGAGAGAEAGAGAGAGAETRAGAWTVADTGAEARAEAGAGTSVVDSDAALEAAEFPLDPNFPHRQTLPVGVRPQLSLSASSCGTHRSQSAEGSQPAGALAGASQAGSEESSFPLEKTCPLGQSSDTASCSFNAQWS